MVERKQNETELGRMMRRYGFLAHKYRDRGYMSCPNCHRAVTACPYCRQDMLLDKSEKKPDFLIAYSYGYVEAKGGGDRWDFGRSITPTQYRVMEEVDDSWLFLEMGTGRAPSGRSAYLVPWAEWRKIEDDLSSKGVASIVYRRGPRGRNPTAEELLKDWRVEWFNGDWIIPKEHVFWTTHHVMEESDD